MSRRAPGLAAFDRSRLATAQFASHGSNLRSSHTQQLATQLAVFKSLLQQFAQTHAKDIRSNPTFRMEFARMCSAIGVDPLASSAGKKGDTGASGSLWSQLLGGSVNDFYFELAVRVVEVCGATREENGGLLSFADCCDRIAKNRMEGAAEITEDDISLAVDTLSPLAGGFATIKLGNERYIRSVPKELSTDAAAVLEAAQLLGYISMSLLMTNLHWPHARSKTVVEDLVMDGMLWVDAQSEEMEFWSPSMMGAED